MATIQDAWLGQLLQALGAPSLIGAIPQPTTPGSYGIAQGARGALVPPTTMMDSPQFLQEPDTSNEPPQPPMQDTLRRNEDEGWARAKDIMNQQGDLAKEIARTPFGDPRLQELLNQYDALDKAYEANKPLWHGFPASHRALRQDTEDIRRDTQGYYDADEIARAAKERAAQPRQPLPPPAPGGVPLNGPVEPVISTLPMS